MKDRVTFLVWQPRRENMTHDHAPRGLCYAFQLLSSTTSPLAIALASSSRTCSRDFDVPLI